MNQQAMEQPLEQEAEHGAVPGAGLDVESEDETDYVNKILAQIKNILPTDMFDSIAFEKYDVRSSGNDKIPKGSREVFISDNNRNVIVVRQLSDGSPLHIAKYVSASICAGEEGIDETYVPFEMEVFLYLG